MTAQPGKTLAAGFGRLAALLALAAAVHAFRDPAGDQGGVARAEQPATPAAMPAPAGTAPGEQADAAPVAHEPGVLGIAKAVYARFGRDNASMVAAGIAFYAFLSIFPAIAALVSVYGLVADVTAINGQVASLSGVLPPAALKLVADGLAGFVTSSSGAHLSLALAASVAAALWSAKAAMSAVMLGLNIAFEETERRSFIVQTLVALALTVGAVLFLATAMLAIAVVPAVLAFARLGSVAAALAAYGRWPALAASSVLAFAVLYRLAPDRRAPQWRWISWGSALATLVWLAGSIGFSYYVSHFGSYDATYGSLGAVVILLLWLWISALILLAGAEVNAELEARDTKAGSPLEGLPPGTAAPAETDMHQAEKARR